ncbi:hypothetical protein [Castellaniella sp.]|uniref:hypothetical protein n=1 Tax=Castellaniella sp. TaxID=1955812 RepID=UPI002B003AB0|nr:hypothetical protein [Castellaniella sp.]
MTKERIMQIDDLTDAEVAIIQAHRAEQARLDAARDFQRKAIATAHAFDTWSDGTGEGLTYSTFINAFGYQAEDGRKVYDAVARILDAAQPR